MSELLKIKVNGQGSRMSMILMLRADIEIINRNNSSSTISLWLLKQQNLQSNAYICQYWAIRAAMRTRAAMFNISRTLWRWLAKQMGLHCSTGPLIAYYHLSWKSTSESKWFRSLTTLFRPRINAKTTCPFVHSNVHFIAIKMQNILRYIRIKMNIWYDSKMPNDTWHRFHSKCFRLFCCM